MSVNCTRKPISVTAISLRLYYGEVVWLLLERVYLNIKKTSYVRMTPTRYRLLSD